MDDNTLNKNNNVFLQQNLNTSQKEAANAFMESKTGEITIVQGPPGTGMSIYITLV